MFILAVSAAGLLCPGPPGPDSGSAASAPTPAGTPATSAPSPPERLGPPPATTIEPGARAAAEAPLSIAHPSIRLLDTDGNDVRLSGRPVSPMRTCNEGCHDTEYIAAHNYHALAGQDQQAPPGQVPGGRPWDTSPGAFGRWSPLAFRYLSPADDARFDLGTPGWVLEFGWRHVGGGPAVSSRTGEPLLAIDPAGAPTLETSVLDEATGEPRRWDWQRSGVAELNCFLCHLARPANDARIEALQRGEFAWAATATLERTGLVERTPSGWRWERSRFDADGWVRGDSLGIRPPGSAHCGQCHGLVHAGENPVWPKPGLSEWSTETTGQVFSAQKMFASAVNLSGKYELDRPWDIHAERLMECTNCHYLMNDPAYSSEVFELRPAHLAFDSRRQEIGEFLKRPDHNFVKGWSAQGTVANSLDGSMRRCEGCHDAASVHTWLPYKKRHMERLLCEACHVPKVHAPARRVTDWTVLLPDGGPRVEYRGVEGSVQDPASLVVGYRPVLLPRDIGDGSLPRLAPHNLRASWYWIYGHPSRLVRLYDLRQAFMEGGVYRPEIVAAFDENGDGTVALEELILDTPRKTSAVRGRLQALGLENLRIAGEIQPFSVHHGVAAGVYVTRACETCHSKSSAITAEFPLADAVPGGVIPALVGDANVRRGAVIEVAADGRLSYRPATMDEGFYVMGHDRSRGVDFTGLTIIVAVILGAFVHGGLRYHHARSRREGT